MIANSDCLDRHGVLFISVKNEAGVYVARTELGERPITAISAVERDLAALELARKVFGDNLSETDLLIAITQSSPGLTRYMAKAKGGAV